jgi:hypothetical protein
MIRRMRGTAHACTHAFACIRGSRHEIERARARALALRIHARDIVAIDRFN